jgi:hypothetical protein
MAERITAPLLSSSLYWCAGELQTPEGGETGIAAERFEDCASEANNADVSCVDAACEQKNDERDGFERHNGDV